MAKPLNIRRILTEEFKREFRSIHGYKHIDQSIGLLKSKFDLPLVQRTVNEVLSNKKEPEAEALRKYHRNNLRYLAKYFAQTLNNQLSSAKVSIKDIAKHQDLLDTAVRIFKTNPQCQVYHQ